MVDGGVQEARVALARRDAGAAFTRVMTAAKVATRNDVPDTASSLWRTVLAVHHEVGRAPQRRERRPHRCRKVQPAGSRSPSAYLVPGCCHAGVGNTSTRSRHAEAHRGIYSESLALEGVVAPDGGQAKREVAGQPGSKRVQELVSAGAGPCPPLARKTSRPSRPQLAEGVVVGDEHAVVAHVVVLADAQDRTQTRWHGHKSSTLSDHTPKSMLKGSARVLNEIHSRRALRDPVMYFEVKPCPRCVRRRRVGALDLMSGTAGVALG